MVHRPNPYRDLSEQSEPKTEMTIKQSVWDKDWAPAVVGVFILTGIFGPMVILGERCDQHTKEQIQLTQDLKTKSAIEIEQAKMSGPCVDTVHQIGCQEGGKYVCHPDAELIVNHAVVECRCRTNKVEK